MFDLTLLGGVRVTHATGEPALVGLQPKRTAVLAYLAAARPRGSQRRDALLAMFWPELDQDRARSALRQALHAMRRSLGPSAISSEGTEVVALNLSAFRCDAWDLEAAVAAGDHSAVVQRYKGELLHGLHVDGAPDFERWLDGERTRVRSLVRTSAWAEAERASSQRCADDVARNANLAVSLSDLDESATCRAMSLLASVGQRAAALALYERQRAELRSELEIEPSGETQALAERIRRTDVAVTPVLSDHRGVDEARPMHAMLPRRRPHWLAAAGVSVVALAAAAQLAPARNAEADPRRIRVEPFAVASVAPALDTLARRAEVETRAALVSVESVRVVDAALDDAAGTIVRGVVHVRGDSIEIRGEVVDRATSVVVRDVKAVGARGEPGLVAVFAERVRAAVATALYPGWGSAMSQPLTYATYRLFLDGLQSIKREQHAEALAAFEQAFALDTSFTSAALLVAMERYQMARFAGADSVVRRIAGRRASLRAIDARLLDWIVRSLEGDRVAARAAMEAVTTIAPTAELAWLQLAVDNVETARPREALAALGRIDPASDFGEGWLSYWATKIEALHLQRDHHREVAVVRDALRRHPNLSVLISYELRALAALGNISEVDEGIRRLSELPAKRGVDVPSTMRQVALELRAHGHSAAAARVIDQARAWYAARPGEERATPAWRSGLARTLYIADDRAGARAMYDSLLRAYPQCIDCAGAVGVLAARDADTATVRASNASLAAIERPFLFGRPLLWRARIAAASGDSRGAANLLHAAFGAGTEFDVMTHADVELARIQPDSIYRRFVRQ